MLRHYDPGNYVNTDWSEPRFFWNKGIVEENRQYYLTGIQMKILRKSYIKLVQRTRDVERLMSMFRKIYGLQFKQSSIN